MPLFTYHCYSPTGTLFIFPDLQDIINHVRKLKQDPADWRIDIVYGNEILFQTYLDDLMEGVYNHG